MKAFHEFFLNVWFQKISILPPQKGLEIPGRRGVSKTQKFKAMYGAKLEFLEGWGGDHRPLLVFIFTTLKQDPLNLLRNVKDIQTRTVLITFRSFGF